MIYSLKLETAMILIGLLLLAVHGVALVYGDKAKAWLKSFPRSKDAGALLLLIAGGWFFWLVNTMDLGEFTTWRRTVLILTPIATLLTWLHVEEFLAVRALGMIVLLGAEPLLEAAWLRPEHTRLLLVTWTFVWIVMALFWVGMPYTLRNQIAWLTRTDRRWKIGCGLGVVYGLVLTLSPLTLHH